MTSGEIGRKERLYSSLLTNLHSKIEVKNRKKLIFDIWEKEIPFWKDDLSKSLNSYCEIGTKDILLAMILIVSHTNIVIRNGKNLILDELYPNII